MSRAAALLLALALGACERPPSEPAPGGRPAGGAAEAPSLPRAARLVGAALDASVGEVFPLGVPAPAGARVVGFTREGKREAALVDARRAWVGRDGAERALAEWSARAALPEPEALARTVGALVYPGCAVLTDAGRGPRPALIGHPGGGRLLTFGYAVPAGRPGEGDHVARWRYTDSGLLIEASPRPEGR